MMPECRRFFQDPYSVGPSVSENSSLGNGRHCKVMPSYLTTYLVLKALGQPILRNNEQKKTRGNVEVKPGKGRADEASKGQRDGGKPSQFQKWIKKPTPQGARIRRRKCKEKVPVVYPQVVGPLIHEVLEDLNWPKRKPKQNTMSVL